MKRHATGLLWGLVLFTALCSMFFFVPLRGQDQAPAALAAIEGIVTQAESGAPLRGARVTVFGTVDPSRPEPKGNATTDADGKFSITGLASGRYYLNVSRSGFVDGGTETIAGPGQRIQNLRVDLVRAAVIAGKVMDENGRPRSQIEVMVARYNYLDGRGALYSNGSAETDDRGEYRISDLVAGEYYVMARRPLEQIQNTVPTFYPGVADRKSAVKVAVGAGAEARPGDFSLVRREKFKITVRMILPAGWPPDCELGSCFDLIPRDRELPQEWAFWHFTRPSTEGRYTSYPVPPGSYDLSVRLGARSGAGPPGPPDPDRSIYGHLAFDVADKDIDVGAITVQPGVRIGGRITAVKDMPGELRAARLTVSLRPIARTHLSFAPKPVVTAEDGSFSFPNVANGRFRIVVSGLPPSLYVDSSSYGGREGRDSGILVEGDPPGPLNIMVAGPGGTIDGVVRNTRDDAVSAAVALVPSPDRRNYSGDFATTVADKTGAFRFSGVRPGDYTVLAWERRPDSIEDPDFLRDVEPRGVPVKVEPGFGSSISVRIIPAAQR